jgi:hypothetical protein
VRAGISKGLGRSLALPFTLAEQSDMWRTTGCLLASFAWLAIAANARPALAQQQAKPEGVGPVEVPADGERNVLAEQFEEESVRQFESNIDQWVFGGRGAAECRKKLESALIQDINLYDRKYGLTPTQKKKLELAGRHDMKRFFDRVEDAKAEFRRLNGDWNQVGDSIFALQRMQNQPHSELFGEESMLAKTLKKNLTPEQIARYDRKVYRDRVEWVAALLDRRLRLNPQQHRRLVDVVVQETPPLKRYGSFDYDAIMFQMSGLTREKLRSALDETQCRELALRFEQARRMQTILVSEGYVTQVKPPAGASAGEAKWQHQEVRR